jgi:hypothetical protein
MYYVLRRDLNNGIPGPAFMVGVKQPSLKKARLLRRTEVHDVCSRVGWYWRRSGARIVLLDCLGVEMAWLVIEDVRKRRYGQERYALLVRGEVVGRHETKEAASKALYREVQRWRSDRRGLRQAIPVGARREWSRQVLMYRLLDKGSFAGTIAIKQLRRD